MRKHEFRLTVTNVALLSEGSAQEEEVLSVEEEKEEVVTLYEWATLKYEQAWSFMLRAF